MTLKEKFEEILIAFWTSDWEGQCEQVAEEFAIGFTDWCVKNELFYSIQYGRIETKELLELYKKQKGL